MKKKDELEAKNEAAAPAPEANAEASASSALAAAAPEAKPEAPPPPPPDPYKLDAQGRMAVEKWAEKLETEAWLFKATRVGLRWPHGLVLTEADYCKGIDWAKNVACR